ncbi:MAG: L,D-transpeptidase family protein [Gammaproteobacteria bacterium]|jgi:murein L,D-transpeptidase YcbB/YkuD
MAFVVYLTFATLACASTSESSFRTLPDPYLWSEPGRPSALAREALSIIEAAPSHGLRIEDYQIDELHSLNERLVPGDIDSRLEYEGLMTDALLRLFRDLRPQLATEVAGESDSADLLALVLLEAARSGTLSDFYQSLLPRHAQYEALRAALVREESTASAASSDAIGRGPPLRAGDSGARVRALRSRLLGSRPKTDNDVFDASLEAAVRDYQSLHGLDADGVVGRRTQQHLDMPASARVARIRLALARWRELPVTLGDEYVHVNIPEFRLEMVRNGRSRVQMRVVVGSKDDPTPAFSDQIEYLVFNPYWHVPRRIALEELVPKAVESPGYLTRQNYDVLAQGEVVEESSVDWSGMNHSSFTYRIRQRPGPTNALGVVKFLFPNPLDIYLHDSPTRSLYARPVRAFSHGCIRLEDPRALAEALLEHTGDWNAEQIADTLDTGRRRQINLERPVPVYLTYITARVTDSGELALFDDVYGRDHSALERYYQAR